MRALSHLALWLLLGFGFALSGYSLVEWRQFHAGNELIRQLILGKDVEVGKIISGKFELRLARAYYLKRRHRYDEAMSTLSLVMDRGSAAQKAETRYNLGNLYLEQALAQAEAMNIDAAMALANLAKQAYRQSLALDSHNWDAKYNLELAMRLLPEMDRINPRDDDEPVNQKSQLWTTVPGFPRGLP